MTTLRRGPAPGTGVCDWAKITANARRLLRRRLTELHELDPLPRAQLVAGCAPRAAGADLLARLRKLGWHRPRARIPFDILETPDCPIPHAPAQREWLRLAIFGPPGEGFTTDHKHREAIFEQRCADILRESRDMDSLVMAGARALAHPAVMADSSLGSMLRAFISQREAELRERLQTARAIDGSKLQHAFERTETDPEAQRERVGKAVTRIRMRLEDALAHYNLTVARRCVCELKNLLKLHPRLLKPGDVFHCESQVTRLEDRLAQFRQHVDELLAAGLDAARRGDVERAAWIDRRLAAVSAMLPEVLPQPRQQEFHERIVKALDQFESRQVARQIIDHERAVAAEIKQLAGVVQRFHKLQRTRPPADPLLAEARRDYEQAVRAIQSRDNDWLAALLMKLDGLLDDLKERDAASEAHVADFVGKVRQALDQLRSAIARPAATSTQPG